MHQLRGGGGGEGGMGGGRGWGRGIGPTCHVKLWCPRLEYQLRPIDPFVDAPANRSWYQAAKKKEERGTRVRLEQFVGTGGSMGGEIERARGQLTDRMGSAVVEGRVVSICGSVGITLIHTHTSTI
jgi:hypothetical protein